MVMPKIADIEGMGDSKPRKPLINSAVAANCLNPYTSYLPCAARNAHIYLNMLRFLRFYYLHFIYYSSLKRLQTAKP